VSAEMRRFCTLARAHSFALSRSLSLLLSLTSALSPSFLAPLSKLSHSPAPISPRPPLPLSLPLSLFLSISLSLSLSPLFYRLLSHSLSRTRSSYPRPRSRLHVPSASKPGGGRRRVKGSEQRADLCTGLYYRPYRGCQQQRRRAPLGRTFAAG